MNEELISVIIPVYNVENYLKKCLNSVINQTYNNLEIIVIDDGSTDQSGAICEEYQIKDGRIKVIHQQNMGLSGARNVGIDICTGKYITFIDSDDSICNSYIETLYNELIINKSDISVCGYNLIDENDVIISKNRLKRKKSILGNSRILKNLLSSQDFGSMAWGKMYKRTLFDNIRYPLGKYHEDVFTTYLLLEKCTSIIIIDEALYNYRFVSNSIMNQSFKLKHLDGVDGCIERAEYISKKFPKVRGYAYATIVHTCCVNYERMLKASFYDKNVISFLQKNIRKYYIYFIFLSRCSIFTKLFASLCFLNMNLCKKIYYLIKKV